jgi:hypothetical protein
MVPEGVRVPRLRFTRAEAEGEAIQRATEVVATLPSGKSVQCVGAFPDWTAAPSRSSKHPVAWVAIFTTPGDIMDGGELFVTVNLDTNTVGLRE